MANRLAAISQLHRLIAHGIRKTSTSRPPEAYAPTLNPPYLDVLFMLERLPDRFVA